MQRNFRVVRAGRRPQKWQNRSTHFLVVAKACNSNLKNLGSSPNSGGVFPDAGFVNRFQSETASCTEKIQADGFIRLDQNVGGFGVELDTANSLDPTVADIDDAIYRVAFTKQDMILFIDGKAGGVVQAFQHIGAEIYISKIFKFVQRQRETVGAIIAVERLAKFRKFAQESYCGSREFQYKRAFIARCDRDGRGSRRSRKECHLAERIPGRYLTDLFTRSALFGY